MEESTFCTRLKIEESLTFQFLFGQVIQFGLKGEWLVCRRLQEKERGIEIESVQFPDLVLWVIILLQVRVRQGLFHCDSARRVET